jgi:hypothetical protein
MRNSSALVAVVLFAAAGLAVARVPSAEESPPKYVGVKKCKLCHVAPSTGAQFKTWEKSEHAKGFASLSSDEAKEIAKEKGIADAANAPECLKCHSTGGGEKPERFNAKFAKDEGVGCEACHGAGEFYAKKEVFEAGREAALAAGLVIGDSKTCVLCHDEAAPGRMHPRIQEGAFAYEEAWKKIAHPAPKKEDAKNPD